VAAEKKGNIKTNTENTASCSYNHIILQKSP